MSGDVHGWHAQREFEQLRAQEAMNAQHLADARLDQDRMLQEQNLIAQSHLDQQQRELSAAGRQAVVDLLGGEVPQQALERQQVVQARYETLQTQAQQSVERETGEQRRAMQLERERMLQALRRRPLGTGVETPAVLVDGTSEADTDEAPLRSDDDARHEDGASVDEPAEHAAAEYGVRYG